jgi:hypothetical protein
MQAGQPVPDDGMGREQAELNIGPGFVRGDMLMDRVCLDAGETVCVMSGIVAATEESDEPFSLLPYDGILGLGLTASSIDMRFNLMGNIAEAGLLKNNMFMVWIAKENDDEDSEITFGTVDDSRIGSQSPIMWLPISNIKNGMFQVKIKDYTISGKKLGLCGEKGCQVAFDTGTSAIAGPSRIITPLLEQLAVNHECANYDSLPLIGFHFGEYELNLERSDYIEKEGSRCWPKINKLDLPPPIGPIMLLGEPFLRRFVTVFDRAALRVGIAVAVHKTPSDVENESMEDAVKRLMVRHETTA